MNTTEITLDIFRSIDNSLNKIANALAYSPTSATMSISESNVLINDKLEELNSIVNDLSEKIDMTTGTAKWIVKPDVSEKSHCSERYYCSKCGKWNSYGETNYCPNCGYPKPGTATPTFGPGSSPIFPFASRTTAPRKPPKSSASAFRP